MAEALTAHPCLPALRTAAMAAFDNVFGSTASQIRTSVVTEPGGRVLGNRGDLLPEKTCTEGRAVMYRVVLGRRERPREVCVRIEQPRKRGRHRRRSCDPSRHFPGDQASAGGSAGAGVVALWSADPRKHGGTTNCCCCR
jgi:hypothetical protein